MNPHRNALFGLAGMVLASFSSPAQAFEDTKVMPAGVRRITLRVLTTNFSEKSNNSWKDQELEKPLEKNLTFRDVLKGEKDPVRRQLTAGYLTYENFGESQALGTFAADLKGRVTVSVPIFTYGLTERLTAAVAVPIYNMSMSLGMGFRANSVGQQFVDSLSDPYNNQLASAKEAGDKINNAVGRLNDKLRDNGFRPLQDWSANGLGDMQILTKFRALDTARLKGAVTLGTVVPTGRVDDPDILIDKGFGDGQWDLFGALAFDEPIFDTGLVANQYVRYTHQLPGRRTVRLTTEDESIEVPKKSVRWKPGDKLETGLSLQYESDMGFVGGAGYNYSQKDRDLYKDVPRGTNVAKDTLEAQNQAEFEVGYSGVPAFRRGEIPVPFESKLNYRHQLSSRNLAVTHFIQFDASVFF